MIYGTWGLSRHQVLEPLGFKPDTGRQIKSLTEARVTACVVTSEGGERAGLETMLTLVEV